jgi:CxxC motif-containing protein (DUF1111 family)
MTTRLTPSLIAALLVLAAGPAPAQFVARDPGPRGGPAGAGGAFATLTAAQRAFFEAGQAAFVETDGIGDGLGPRFNLDSCAGCHAQPAVGGSSPAANPQVAIATARGARNAVPSFIRSDGPVREARFKYNADGTRDGGVHALFVISGRLDDTGDATGCTIAQEDFETPLARDNLAFRVPTPTFGLGLIEAIPDATIVANQAASAATKAALGVRGRPQRLLPAGDPNRSGNDGTIARFGWKAQNKSLLMFAGEAYNVEQGISNELFPQEREEACQYAPAPNDTTDLEAVGGPSVVSDIEKFAFFMRFLAPPRPSATEPGGAGSIGRGRQLFTTAGCALCHTPTLRTGNSPIAALRYQNADLYSDLLLHNMGPGLADDIVQGLAGGDAFRTAPLWGLGQRLFFLHDGRTTDLVEAIAAHRSAADATYGASEANAVVDRFRALSEAQKQDLLNFLRSL